MSAVASCPDAAVLRRFAVGEVSAEEFDSLPSHILACPNCLRTLDSLPGRDTLIEALATSPPLEVGHHPELLHALVERLKAGQLSVADSHVDGTQNTTVDTGFGAGPSTPAEGGAATEILSPPQLPDEIGRLGPYRVLGILGEGGMGMVFDAEDPHLKRRVALKVMKPSLAEKESARQRFRREAQAMAAVRDDHVVTVFQVGEDNGVPFVAMEYLEGQSLDDLLKKAGKLNTAQALRIGIQIAQGLAAAHARGLIHRDIKPGNIWIEPVHGGRVKILDFGLVRAAEEETHITQSGIIVGTPAYMSPEQAQGEPVDHRTDLFSLGTVLYRIATGRRPFQASNTTGMLLALSQQTPPEPITLTPAMPAALNDLITGLLAKAPAERPESARRVASELKKIEKDLRSASQPAKPVPDKDATPPLPMPAPRRRRLRPVALIAAALLFLIGGGLLIPQFVIRLRDKDGKVISETKVPEGVKVEIEVGEKKPAMVGGDHDRQVAEWALSLNAVVDIEVGGESREITTSAALPAGAFHLTAVSCFKGGRDNRYKITDDELMRMKGLTNLTHLSLYNTRITGAGVVHLKDLKNLIFLCLSGTEVTDASLVHLKDLKTLSSLDLSNTQVSGTGLVHLKDLTNLSRLFLHSTHNTQVNDARLVHLKDLTNLRWLSLDGTPVSDSGLVHLKDLKNLSRLTLAGTKVSDAGLVHLKHLENLSELRLQNTRVTGVGLVHLKELENLNLQFGGRQVTDAGLAQLKEMKNLSLNSLDCGGSQVSDAGLVHLKDLKNLKYLQLNATRVSGTGLVHLKELKNLRLDFGGNQISDAGLAQLKEMRNLSLHDLDLQGAKVSDAGLAHLKDLRSLSVLRLNNTQVSDASLAHLNEMTHLTELYLHHTKVGDAGLAHLIDLKNLKMLVLHDTQVTDAGLVHLRKLKSLKQLNLTNTQVSDVGLVHLMEMKDLDLLHMHNTKVSDSGLVLLTKLNSLSAIGLNDTSVTDTAVLEFVLSRNSLTKLFLERTRVTAQAAELVRTTFPEANVTWSEPNHSAAMAILKLGGAVHVSAKDNDEVRKVQDPADLPTKYFQVRRVDLTGIKAPLHDVFRLLAQLTDPEFDRLETLDLSGSAVTGSDLEILKPLVGLRTLSLDGTKLTYPELAQLAGLSGLHVLSLKDTPITDLGLAHIAKNLIRCIPQRIRPHPTRNQPNATKIGDEEEESRSGSPSLYCRFFLA